MATPEDSSVLRQLIDQIDGELSSFQDLSGSDRSLASGSSFATSQESFASSPLPNHVDSRSGSNLTMPSVTTRDFASRQPRPTSATSAIFGTSFERQTQQQQQQHQQQSNLGATSLVLNGSYFLGPRAPQYIPSPMASPISPNADNDHVILDDTLDHGDSIAHEASGDRMLKGAASHGSLSAMAAELLENDDAHQQDTLMTTSSANLTQQETTRPSSSTIMFDDTIKVEVTEKQPTPSASPASSCEALSKQAADYKVERQDQAPSGKLGGMVTAATITTMTTATSIETETSPEMRNQSSSDSLTAGLTTTQPPSLPLQLLELSFSSNDLSSLWNPISKSTSAIDLGSTLESSDKRSRSHTFHGLSDVEQDRNIGNDNNIVKSGSILSTRTETDGTLKSVVATHGLSNSLDTSEKDDQEIMPSSEQDSSAIDQDSLEPGRPDNRQANRRVDRKRLSLVTSGVGLAAAAATASRSTVDKNAVGDATMKKSFLDLPTWDLAPLSPPVIVKETTGAGTLASSSSSGGSAVSSPMNARKGSVTTVRQETVAALADNNTIMSPASATVLTPTTPLTTRESRILVGREALLRVSPERQRATRGSSFSSTTSSGVSSLNPSSGSSEPSATAVEQEETETVGELQDANRRDSIKGIIQTGGGVYGAVPQRGQLKDVSPSQLVFPDQSVRPVPLKAYKIRKMTLSERTQTYVQAYQEFTKARTGLDIWVLRCMMQDRPALMKDPPAIVKAVAGKFTPSVGGTIVSAQGVGGGQDQRSQTPTSSHSSHTVASSLSSHSTGGGIGARIKNAGKRLSMDISGGIPSHSASGISSADLLASGMNASGPPSSGHNGPGSLFYKQKSAKSAVELGSWSSSRARLASGSNAIPPQASPSPSTSSHRHSIIGTPTLQRASIGGATPSSASPLSMGSGFLAHNKRNSLGVGGGIGGVGNLSSSSPANSIRGRTMSDVHASGSRFLMHRSQTQGSGLVRQEQQHQPLDQTPPPGSDFMKLPARHGGSSGGGPLSPTLSTSSTGSLFMERPIKRSNSSLYSRRPASMMVVPSSSIGEEQMQQQQQDEVDIANPVTGSKLSLASQSASSLGSLSTPSFAESQKSPSSAVTTGFKQEEEENEDEKDISGRESKANYAPTSSSTTTTVESTPAMSSYYNAEGGLIPYADDATSKEVYSPLTSPILIPLGGFPEPRKTPNQLTSPTNGGWRSPLSAGGLTRPLTFAGQPSYAFTSTGSNSSLVMSPTSQGRSGAAGAASGLGVGSTGAGAIGGGGGGYVLPGSGMVQYPGQKQNTQEKKSDKPEKSEKSEKSSKFGATLNRYSTASSFASIGSFSKQKAGNTQKRQSKKEKKKEQQAALEEKEKLQYQDDQRFSVASHTVAATNDFLVEQSLDKLSDVLPQVDRDQLAIYLQRASGDEMVAIGLAMSDFKTGLL